MKQTPSYFAFFFIAFAIIISSKVADLDGMVIPRLGAFKRCSITLSRSQSRMDKPEAANCWGV